jgi:flagellar biosynthesis/type III secretory pathway M-ring protein FliF/YscJ
MIALLTIKTFFKKAWVWLKHNWKVPLIVLYTIVLWLFFRRRDKAREVLEVRAESYEAQIEVINKAHTEEIKKRDQVLKQYVDIISQLEKEYAEKKKDLDKKKKKEVKELVEKYYNKPDDLAREIAEKFGLEYIE